MRNIQTEKRFDTFTTLVAVSIVIHFAFFLLIPNTEPEKVRDKYIEVDLLIEEEPPPISNTPPTPKTQDKSNAGTAAKSVAVTKNSPVPKPKLNLSNLLGGRTSNGDPAPIPDGGNISRDYFAEQLSKVETGRKPVRFSPKKNLALPKANMLPISRFRQAGRPS